jgi:hypothetical protein
MRRRATYAHVPLKATGLAVHAGVGEHPRARHRADAEWPQTAPLWYPPDSIFRYPGDPYSSVAFNHFSLIFQNVSGLEASEYLRRAVLGLSVSAGGVSDHDGDEWHEVGGGGQWPDGRARFLMLREGDWNGRAPASRRVEIDRESLERFFDAVTDR